MVYQLYSRKVEESNGKLCAFEFKYSVQKKVKPPASFLRAYPDAEFKVITPSNVEEFLLV